MPSFKLENKSIGGSNDGCYIVAEIGQNHQGDVEIAKEMILEAKKAGCDCVKFQKSNLEAKFTKSALNRPYDGPNSWGKTYGQHKQFIEFTLRDFQELQCFAKDIGIDFSASAMDLKSFIELRDLNLPFIKIGSGDANNFHMMKFAAMQKVPLIISTGMQDMGTIQEIVSIMKEKPNYCLLHCVSAYPTKAEDATLQMIPFYQDNFPNVVIGYSGHEQGINLSIVAVLLGAKVIERHFTLDKSQKGTDHKCSLNPWELTQMIKKIRTVEAAKPKITCASDVVKYMEDHFPMEPKDLEDLKLALRKSSGKKILDCEMECRRKLGKSVVYTKNLEKGSCVSGNDMTVKVTEPFGISAEFIDFFEGKKLKRSVRIEDSVSKDDFH